MCKNSNDSQNPHNPLLSPKYNEEDLKAELNAYLAHTEKTIFVTKSSKNPSSYLNNKDSELGSESEIDKLTRRNTRKNTHLNGISKKEACTKRETRTEKYVRFEVPRSRSLDLESSDGHGNESEGVRLDLYSHYSKRYNGYETEPHDNCSQMDTERNYSSVSKYQSVKEPKRCHSFQGCFNNTAFTNESVRMKDIKSNMSYVDGKSKNRNKSILIGSNHTDNGSHASCVPPVISSLAKTAPVDTEKRFILEISTFNLVLSIILLLLIAIQLLNIFGSKLNGEVCNGQ
ncbi:unnamed protein product [Moneuplotes crassus]|uniref:Uncharacterized protein n=1 Tax=Euplotes crassus TaxID=5936 RepID=A0AAD2CXU9_EUPCR|nr:unnamed protein product [Moneuplotes crassus]